MLNGEVKGKSMGLTTCFDIIPPLQFRPFANYRLALFVSTKLRPKLAGEALREFELNGDYL